MNYSIAAYGFGSCILGIFVSAVSTVKGLELVSVIVGFVVVFIGLFAFGD